MSKRRLDLPSEMLIKKLVDGFDTPKLVQQKQLPIPIREHEQPSILSIIQHQRETLAQP